MQIELAYCSARASARVSSKGSKAGKAKFPEAEALTAMYVERSSRYSPVSSTGYVDEAELLAAVDGKRGGGVGRVSVRVSGRVSGKATSRASGRTSAVLVLLDSRGRSFTSEEFATWLGERRDSGQQKMVFAIGPADGWSEAAIERADAKLSLSGMTLAHELARVVLAEQIYRALTILAGHPYHLGH